MERIYYLLLLLAGGLFTSCGKPAVKVVDYNGDDVYVCDFFNVSDQPVELRLSDFVDSLRVVRLADDTNAIIGNSQVYLSEHYIMVRPDWKSAIKLFDSDGNYLNDVGKIGRGPGEYGSVQDMQIDEENGRIYVMPINTFFLYTYDLEGNYVGAVRLAGGFPKGKFEVKDSCVWAVTIPFKGKVKWAAIYQALDGELLDSVAATPFVVNPVYSHELFVDRANRSIYFSIWNVKKQDALYRYEPGNNRLTPRFIVNFGGVKEIPMHVLHEMGNYFWFQTMTIQQVSANSFEARPDKSVLVDKKQLTATSTYKIINDFLGYPTSLSNFSNGYYTENLSPLQFKEKLERADANSSLSPEVRERVRKWLADIDEDGNNYVIIGKMK